MKEAVIYVIIVQVCESEHHRWGSWRRHWATEGVHFTLQALSCDCGVGVGSSLDAWCQGDCVGTGIGLGVAVGVGLLGVGAVCAWCGCGCEAVRDAAVDGSNAASAWRARGPCKNEASVVTKYMIMVLEEGYHALDCR